MKNTNNKDADANGETQNLEPMARVTNSISERAKCFLDTVSSHRNISTFLPQPLPKQHN
jgi:hypothetical protein